jgi:hypothetical protein
VLELPTDHMEDDFGGFQVAVARDKHCARPRLLALQRRDLLTNGWEMKLGGGLALAYDLGRNHKPKWLHTTWNGQSCDMLSVDVLRVDVLQHGLLRIGAGAAYALTPIRLRSSCRVCARIHLHNASLFLYGDVLIPTWNLTHIGRHRNGDLELSFLDLPQEKRQSFDIWIGFDRVLGRLRADVTYRHRL